MKKVLVIDDEPSIVTLLTFNLEKENYEVHSALDGLSGYQMAQTETFDFIILDVMLPGMDGFEITKALRAQKVQTPILMLTAKDEQIDKIVGLEMGADDYLTKPFSLREISARMKAIFRRSRLLETTPSQDLLQIGQITVNQQNYEGYVRDQKLTLTPKEFELLVYFMQRQDQVITRETLLAKIWQYDFTGQSRIVDIHVSHLRDKIERNPKKPEYLVTVRGFGYRFQEPKR